MAFRRISREDRVNAVKECIEIKNVKEVAKKYGISEAMLKEDCNDILKETEEILKKNSLVGKLKRRLKRLYQRLFP